MVGHGPEVSSSPVLLPLPTGTLHTLLQARGSWTTEPIISKH